MPVVRVHHPDLTPEEREKRIQRLEEALLRFYNEVSKMKQSEATQIKNREKRL